jgi:CheY-like chemotaxis protein
MHQVYCRVLVAEDDRASREMIVAFLELHGHIVVSVPDGGAAVAVARHFHPDVVITDICMPVLTGIEVCRQLHEDPHTCRIRVLAMTALSRDEWHSARLAGFDEILSKPLELDELEHHMMAAFDRCR